MEILRFIETFKTRGEREPSEATKNSYHHSLALFQSFLERKAMEELNDDAVKEFKKHLLAKGLKASSISRHIKAIKAYFNWKGLDFTVKAPGYDLPEPKWLAKEEIERLIGSCNTPMERCLIVLLYDSGMRIGELLKVRIRDIDFKNGFIHVERKGGRKGYIPIYEPSIKAIERFISWKRGRVKNDDYLFPFKYFEIWRWLKMIGLRVGMPDLHPHVLRHSKASSMRLRGIPIEDVKDWLGHVNIQTTMRYAHLLPTDLKKKVGSEFEVIEGRRR